MSADTEKLEYKEQKKESILEWLVASCLMASVSGSAVANVVTTGSFTIQLMKRIGYRPYFAGAVEACASSDGQIMPPVMGAAAFVIAEFLNLPCLQVALMIIGYTPMFAAFWAIISILALSFVRKETRMTIQKKLEWLLLAATAILFLVLK